MIKYFKFVILLVFIAPNISKSQIISTTLEANWVYVPQNPVDFKKTFLLKAGIENWFTKRIALGVNLQSGMTSISKEDYTAAGGHVVSEKDLKIDNLVFSLNIYTKFAFLAGDDYCVSIKPELGSYWVESMPTITFIDHTTSSISVKQYSRVTKNSFSVGLGIQGQYYISERWDICLNLGYNNYDNGKSLNGIDLKGDWSNGFNEKTCFISAGLGFHYYLFGIDKR
jgi:hypothetical protein